MAKYIIDVNPEQVVALISLGIKVETLEKTATKMVAKSKSNGKSKLNASECKVEFTSNGKTVSLKAGVSRDVWGCIVKHLGEYDKATKTFTLKTAKEAKALATNGLTITADERNTFRKEEWGWS